MATCRQSGGSRFIVSLMHFPSPKVTVIQSSVSVILRRIFVHPRVDTFGYAGFFSLKQEENSHTNFGTLGNSGPFACR